MKNTQVGWRNNGSRSINRYHVAGTEFTRKCYLYNLYCGGGCGTLMCTYTYICIYGPYLLFLLFFLSCLERALYHLSFSRERLRCRSYLFSLLWMVTVGISRIYSLGQKWCCLYLCCYRLVRH